MCCVASSGQSPPVSLAANLVVCVVGGSSLLLSGWVAGQSGQAGTRNEELEVILEIGLKTWVRAKILVSSQ